MAGRAKPQLSPRLTPGAEITALGDIGWRLEIPPGPQGIYRLAQLDDYEHLRRSAFPWRPPVTLRLRARASSPVIPGTWGFGFWNDPFGLSILRGVEKARFPALPNAAWHFFASPENYLSLRDDLPAHGAMAASFRSPNIPVILFLPLAPLMPLALLPPIARLFRRVGRIIVRQDASGLAIDPTEWHLYVLAWRAGDLRFEVDGSTLFRSGITPNGRLGLVIWIDNQFAAIPPAGRMRFGTLANPEPAWVEVEGVELSSGSA